MKKYLLALLFILGICIARPAKAQTINCPSGFTGSGACSVASSLGAQTFWNQNALSGSEAVIIPTGCTHCGQSMNTQAKVNVQAFTATWTFIPNEWNGAFILQNNLNNQASGGLGALFSAGAGCEAGFYQAFNSSGKSTDHVFALMFSDNYSNLSSSSGFVYSTAQIYQPQQSPCNPNDTQPWYWSTTKISTSPVPTTSPASSINTTTGDKYSATLVYDGNTLTYSMFDVTAGGSCPGASCFTQSWNNINIPSMVGSNTAYLGISGGTGNTPSAFPFKVDSLVYTVNTPPSVPAFQTYTSGTAAGTVHATAPTFSPAAGSYSSTQSVTISSATSGSYICYTLSASTPALMPMTDQVGGCTVGTLYTGAVSVSSSQTLYAMAGTVAVTLGISGPPQRANSNLTVGSFTIGAITYPVTYGFPGTIAPAGFTTPIAHGSFTGTVVNASSNANLVSVGGLGAASYTGAPFVSFGVTDQYSQVSYTTAGGFEAQGVTSPCVNMTTGGNGVCYDGAAKGFVTWTAGVPTTLGATCFFPGANDTLRISVTGNSYTATETAFGGSCTQTITGFSGGGQPGFLLDQTTDSATRVQAFQADCFPSSCGVAAAPAASPTPGSYIFGQTVALTTTTPGASICYTIDGSTPLAATPGTCSHGTTYSTSISVPSTETIKAIATISGGANSAVQSFLYTITGVTITSNIPVDGYWAFPDSTRQVWVNINGTSNLVTWSVVSGDISVSDSTCTNQLPTCLVTIGSTAATSPGTITPASGNPGPYTLTPWSTPVVRATSVDDPTKHVDLPFNIVEPINQVMIQPVYQQAWKNTPVILFCHDFGIAAADETCVFTITTNPGSAGSLDGAICVGSTANSCRDTAFTGTASGRYVITATHGSNSGQAAVWVTSASAPAYASTPNWTLPVPCDPTDPAFSHVFHIGPSQANTTISSVVNGSVPTGSIFLLHNEDTTGLSPTQYHEYIQWNSGGTFANPVWFCVVPDSLGNAPIMEGDHSTGNANINHFGAAGIAAVAFYASLNGGGTPYNNYQFGSTGPSNIGFTGVHIRDYESTTPYYPPGKPNLVTIARSGGTTTAVVSNASNYNPGDSVKVEGVTGGSTSFNGTFGPITVSGTTLTWPQSGANESGTAGSSAFALKFFGGSILSCILQLTGSYNFFEGLDTENCPDAYFLQDNAEGHAWGGISANITIEGFHAHGFGENFEPLTHGMYIQGNDQIVFNGILESPVSGIQGGCMKDRGLDTVIAYVDCEPGPTRGYGGVEDQGSYPYVGLSFYLPEFWATNDTGGLQVTTAMTEALQTTTVYGSIFSTGALRTLQYAEDGSGGEFSKSGQLTAFNNTIANPQYIVDNGSNGSGYGALNFYSARFHLYNNNFWNMTAVNAYSDFIGDFATNMYQTGWGTSSGTITGPPGWVGVCDNVCPWQLTNPLNPHMHALGSGNFLTTTPNPMNPATYAPITSSPLIGAGTTSLPGLASFFKLRYYYDVTSHSLKPRTDNGSTIGAVPGGSSPPPPAANLTVHGSVVIRANPQ